MSLTTTCVKVAATAATPYLSLVSSMEEFYGQEATWFALSYAILEAGKQLSENGFSPFSKGSDALDDRVCEALSTLGLCGVSQKVQDYFLN